MTLTPRKRADKQGGEAERAPLPDPAWRLARSLGAQGRYSPRLSGARRGEVKPVRGARTRRAAALTCPRAGRQGGSSVGTEPEVRFPRSAWAASCRSLQAGPGVSAEGHGACFHPVTVSFVPRGPLRGEGGTGALAGGCRGPSPEAGCSEGPTGRALCLDSARPPALGLRVPTQATAPGPGVPTFPKGTAFHPSPHLLPPTRLAHGPPITPKCLANTRTPRLSDRHRPRRHRAGLTALSPNHAASAGGRAVGVASAGSGRPCGRGLTRRWAARGRGLVTGPTPPSRTSRPSAWTRSPGSKTLRSRNVLFSPQNCVNTRWEQIQNPFMCSLAPPFQREAFVSFRNLRTENSSNAPEKKARCPQETA